MSGWTSLTGYLSFKPGGALSRLKSRKRMWCALEESKCQLLYYKSEEDARSKPPAGEINLKGAAITLDLDNQNQFIIITEGKEIALTAENHESMMIWLMALQAKRDLHTKAQAEKEKEPKEQLKRERRRHTAFCREHIWFHSSSDITAANPEGSRHKPLCYTQSLQSNGVVPSSMSPLYRHYQLQKIGETFDASMLQRRASWVAERPVVPSARYEAMNRVASTTHEKVDRSRSLPPVFEDFMFYDEDEEVPPVRWRSSISHPIEIAGMSLPPYCRQLSVSMDSCGPQQNGYLKSNSYHGDSSSGSTGDSDEIFGEKAARKKTKSKGDNSKRKMKSKTVDHDSDGEQYPPYEMSRSEERNRNSSMSASSDSAIDKGEMGPQEFSRISDLEKELIATKCELAKVMNRQTCFQDIIKQKDEIILDLDEKLGSLGSGDQAYDSKKRTSKASKEFQERVRVLQNQNRFLNEEVKRLAKLRSREQSLFTEQDNKVHSLEADIEKWKFDYVSLIQSSIRFTGTDTMDDAELSLFGGDRHKVRVQGLLEEARKINPSLPTYERLANHDVHVDCYGFKHQFDDPGLLLHYLCQELCVHYLTQAGTYEKHQHRWHTYLKQNAKNIIKNPKELKPLCRGGIPDQYRKQVWRQLVHAQVQDIITEKGSHYFRNLCNLVPDSPLAARYRKQVSLDLMRTMPSNVKFAAAGSRGIMDLQDILLAFCIHNPAIGYCQGMNFIVGMALLFMDAQDAFWTLVAITERYFSSNYFDHNLVGAQADQLVLKALIEEKLPNLAGHLQDIDIEVSTVTLNWFLAIFFDAVPFQTLLRIWDCFLLEGPKVLFRFCLAILKMHKKEILLKSDTISVMRHLKACAKITYDTDGLVKVAFEDMKPFASRQNIQTKQTCYLNMLKEKYKRKEIQKLAFAEREQLFLSIESESGNYLSFECCAVGDNGSTWLCFGEQTFSKVCQVNAEKGVMMSLNVEFDTRVMCMQALPDNVVLFGTLSWMVYAYDMNKREKLWQMRLHDAVLSICLFVDEENCCRVFAGLADGTIAILENVANEVPSLDVMYIPIGQSPVMCVKLIGHQLWCACGNKVYIIHANTLDAMDNFTVSSNPYDHILSLEPSQPGIWISIRGSSILELWDSVSLNCKMLYDTRAGRYPNLRKEDDSYFNRARITSILPHDNTVWIGTGEGNLIIYEVVETPHSQTPSEVSYNESTTDSCHLTRVESYDPIRAVEEKVRELYYRNLNSPEIEPKKYEPWRMSGNLGSRSSLDNTSNSTNTVIPETDDGSESFYRNNLVTSTPNDSAETNESSPSSWFDSCGKNFSHHLQFDSNQNHSLFTNIEEEKEKRGSPPDTPTGKDPEGKNRKNLFNQGKTFKMSESDSVLSNGDLSVDNHEGVSETPVSSPLCNGDVKHVFPEQKSEELSEDVTMIEHEFNKSVHDNDSTDNTLDSCDSQDLAKSSRSRKLADLKSLSADSGIKISSEDQGQNSQSSNPSKTPESASSTTPKQVKEETDSDQRKICENGTQSAQDCESESCEEIKLSPAHSQHSVHSEGDYMSAKETETDLFGRDTPNCNESFKRLRRLSEQRKHLKKKNRLNGAESDDDVFVDAIDRKAKRASSMDNLLSDVESLDKVISRPRRDSDCSDIRKNLKPKNQETQWRIDFTGYHVDTDCESRMSMDCSDFDSASQGHRPSIDSQPELKRFATKCENSISKFDPQDFIFPEDYSLEQKMAKFLDTPSFGTPLSSSADVASTASREPDTSSLDHKRSVFIRGETCHSDVSRGTSSISLATMAESLYSADLFVQAKVKISDKPVKCLLHFKGAEEPLILSLSGSFGDDEAVLKWKKAPNEQMIWTNDPVLELCLDTNTTKLPSYMRNRMSSTSSITSNKSNKSTSSV